VRSRDGIRAITGASRGGSPASIRDWSTPLRGGQRFESVEAMIESTLYGRRLTMKLVVGSPCVHSCSRPIGMYGIVSYGIVQRTRSSLVLRKALGATDRNDRVAPATRVRADDRRRRPDRVGGEPGLSDG